MDIEVEYLCDDDRTGVHVFSVRDDAPADFVSDETARHVRNICALIGPALIRIASPGNALAGCADSILESTWLLGPDHASLIEIASKWRGTQTKVEFIPERPIRLGPHVLSTGAVRPPGPPPPVLVVNIGQSEVKFSMVAESLEVWDLGIIRRSPRAPVLLNEVGSGIITGLRRIRSVTGGPASVVFSVGALVGKRQITVLPNGITSGLSAAEIQDLRDGLTALPGRLGISNAQVSFVNDGFLVAMAHADLSARNSTFVLRGGTSLCGGIDDERVLGEVGWVALPPDSAGDGRGGEGHGGRTLLRDLLSADAFLAVDSHLRAGHLAISLCRLLAVVSCIYNISRIVLCGSLFTAVDHAEFRRAYSQFSARLSSFHAIDRVTFSELESQRNLAARGIVNMVMAGAAR